MLKQLVDALILSKNESADDVLLDALRLGNDNEKLLAMSALMKRQTTHGLSGIVGAFAGLSENLRGKVLNDIKQFHTALRECGRSEDKNLRLGAMRLIALGRQGKLTYVLSESLHSTNEEFSKGAVEAIVALSRWVATETRRLQREGIAEDSPQAATRAAIYHDLNEQRADIEQAVARALDVHRGPHGADLLRAALLLADWAGSKTLAILQTAKHGGQSPMVRRLQQPPEAENVEAFLMGAAHGGLRSHFGVVFARIEEAPVLDALLRRTHWLRDHQLQLCMHQVTRGAWWQDAELVRDLSRRDPADAGKIGEWIAVSGVHDVVQDERMDRLRIHAAESFEGRLRLLRLAIKRPRGASVQLIRSFLADPDERLVRLAAREIVRRRPADFENMLIQLMTTAPLSVRSVITRSVGQAGFENFWQRFDRMDRSTRKAAGRAMLKILPDGIARLTRRLTTGPAMQQIKAIQIAQELGVVDALAPALQQLCSDPNPKLRSKAVSALGEMEQAPTQMIMDKLLTDSDARVRANAIEVLETRQAAQYVSMLAVRARSSHNRERANAIKALLKMRVSTAVPQLQTMLTDERPDHRISAMWTLRQTGWWKLLSEVATIARSDTNIRARRYAMALLKDVAQMLREKEAV